MAYPVWALVVGSIATTVALVAVNKVVFSAGFPFVLTLGTMHFVTTYLVTVVLAKGFRAFEPKFLPFATNLLVAAMGVGSIGFMNYSLKFNSVGMYQMAKLTIIPVVLTYNACKGEFVTRKVFVTLVAVLLGVGIATVTDVKINSKGLLFATAAVLATAQYQIWQGSKQREHGLTEMQMTMSISSLQMVVGAFFAALIEGPEVYATVFGTEDKPSRLNMNLMGQIALSCLLAACSNLHSFALIGRTSPVTFQVVGHGKTCLILLAGYIMEPLPSVHEFLYNLSGVIIAVFGVILYSNLKMSEGKHADWCDLYLPSMLLNILSGSKSSTASGAEKGTYQKITAAEKPDEEV